MTKKNTYDVIIVGAGIAGTVLGTILAKKNVKTLILEGGSHPKFAIGESMIPATSFMLRLMSERYDIPELVDCSVLPYLNDRVSNRCGIKRNFSFVYHREGMPQDLNEMTQLPVPIVPYGAEAHLYRQDVDAYYLQLAIKYGAVVKQLTRVDDIDIKDDGVAVSCGEDTYLGDYLVDGTGYSSVLSKALGNRDEEPRFTTDSRSIFTHMIGVPSYDDISKNHELPSKIHKGTLHHIFDGGWIWVIPFDNHKDAVNPVCSVGLQLDRNKFPEQGIAPEIEFQEFIEKFPQVREHLENAKPIRNWISTGRLQYSSSSVIGDRYCLLAHASAFIDPLFSRGLAITVETINALSQRLIDAVESGKFSKDDFDIVDKIVTNSYDINDRLVSCCYVAFRSFKLWNAFYRVWALGQAFTSIRLTNLLSEYYAEKDVNVLSEIERAPFIGSLVADFDEFQELFAEAASIIDLVKENSIDEDEACARIYALYDKPYVPPQYELTNPERKYISDMSLSSLLEVMEWGSTHSPVKVKNLYFNQTEMMGSE